jgi:GTPase SAR1 family protein
VNKILVGNKGDLESMRQVSREDGKALGDTSFILSADLYNIPYIETSAKSGTEIDKAFAQISTQIIKRIGPQ